MLRTHAYVRRNSANLNGHTLTYAHNHINGHIYTPNLISCEQRPLKQNEKQLQRIRLHNSQTATISGVELERIERISRNTTQKKPNVKYTIRDAHTASSRASNTHLLSLCIHTPETKWVLNNSNDTNIMQANRTKTKNQQTLWFFFSCEKWKFLCNREYWVSYQSSDVLLHCNHAWKY